MSNILYFRRRLATIVAIVMVVLLYQINRVSGLSEEQTQRLASHFNFTTIKLPELAGYAQKNNRVVNRSLERLSAWVSTLGAAVALNDLDGDGLANDLCYVDPRSDQVIVAPVPETGQRYQPFVLDS